jgi:hypothetical protein
VFRNSASHPNHWIDIDNASDLNSAAYVFSSGAGLSFGTIQAEQISTRAQRATTRCPASCMAAPRLSRAKIRRWSIDRILIPGGANTRR